MLMVLFYTQFTLAFSWYDFKLLCKLLLYFITTHWCMNECIWGLALAHNQVLDMFQLQALIYTYVGVLVIYLHVWLYLHPVAQ